MKNKEELMYELSETTDSSKDKRYAMCIMTYHHEQSGNPAYLASLLQSIKKMNKRRQVHTVPFLVYAQNDEALEVQFGKTPETRTLSFRSAAKQGMKGIVIGNLETEETSEIFIQKIIDILEDDELEQMSPIERHIRKLINRAYAFLNKMFGTEEEKEENINTAIILFEEVLDQSKDNCEALLGKAIACASSSELDKIREGSELFVKLEIIGEDMDLKKGTVLIRQGKGRKDRIVPIGKTALKWVRLYLKRVRPRFMGNKTPALFLSVNGEKLSGYWVTTTLKECVYQAKIKKRVTPHTIRHTMASHLVLKGADITVVQRILGHERLETTTIYTRVFPTDT